MGDKFLLSSDSTSKWSPVRPLVRRGRLGRHIVDDDDVGD